MNTLRIFSHLLPDDGLLGRNESINEDPLPLRVIQKARDIGAIDYIPVRLLQLLGCHEKAERKVSIPNAMF